MALSLPFPSLMLKLPNKGCTRGRSNKHEIVTISPVHVYFDETISLLLPSLLLKLPNSVAILRFHSHDETSILVSNQCQNVAQVLHNNRIKIQKDFFAIVRYSILAAVTSHEKCSHWLHIFKKILLLPCHRCSKSLRRLLRPFWSYVTSWCSVFLLSNIWKIIFWRTLDKRECLEHKIVDSWDGIEACWLLNKSGVTWVGGVVLLRWLRGAALFRRPWDKKLHLSI